jgi:hypothetical protein
MDFNGLRANQTVKTIDSQNRLRSSNYSNNMNQSYMKN